jgi:transposase InsO family protein
MGQHEVWLNRILGLFGPTPAEHRGRLLQQDPARERERSARLSAVALAEAQLSRGRSLADAATLLGLDAETLRSWCAKVRVGQLVPLRRGRPAQTMTRVQRQQAIDTLDARRGAGVGSLREQMPELGRNAVQDFVRRHRSIRAKRRRRTLCWLEWHVPGAVWAIDGTLLAEPIAGHGRRLLTVVDLGSGETIACLPIPGESADAVIAALASLVARFGTPIVIKWDNGSGFVADAVRAWCAARGITLMHSPPRRPTYNGACESHNRWAKARILAAAAAAGRSRRPQVDDLRAACTWQGRPHSADENLRQAFQAAFADQLGALCTARGLADVEAAGHAMRRSLERVAARRALELCHILTIRGRDYRW